MVLVVRIPGFHFIAQGSIPGRGSDSTSQAGEQKKKKKKISRNKYKIMTKIKYSKAQ